MKPEPGSDIAETATARGLSRPSCLSCYPVRKEGVGADARSTQRLCKQDRVSLSEGQAASLCIPFIHFIDVQERGSIRNPRPRKGAADEMHSRVVPDRSSYGLQPSPTRCANVDAASLPRRITIQPGRGRDAASTVAPYWDWEVFLSRGLRIDTKAWLLRSIRATQCIHRSFRPETHRSSRFDRITG